MFQVKSFKQFAPVTEGLGSNVWKIDADKPDSPDHLAKFSFTAKVQHPEGSSDKDIGKLTADFLNSQLQASSQFMNTLQRTGGIPVIFAQRNTTGGFLTGDRGVLKGSIVLVDPKKYDANVLNSTPGFKPAGSDVEIMVNGKKVYDGEKLSSTTGDKPSNLPPNYDPNAPVLNSPQAAEPSQQGKEEQPKPGQEGQAKPAGKTEKPETASQEEIIAGLMGMEYGKSSSQIKTLNGCLIILEPTLTPSLVEYAYTEKADGTKVKDGLDISDTYGDATAAALAKVLGKTEPIKQITKEIATELNKKITPITKTQFNQKALEIRTGNVKPTGGNDQKKEGQPEQAAVTAETLAVSVEDLIKDLAKGSKGPKVGVLQLVLSAVNPEAKKKIDASRGIDSNYGGGTATAVGIVLGQSNLPIPKISTETASIIANKIKSLDAEKVKQLAADINTKMGGSASAPYNAKNYRKSANQTAQASDSSSTQSGQSSPQVKGDPADQLSARIVALFKKDENGNNLAFWKAAAADEGNDNVDEDKASNIFNAWWNKNIKPVADKLGGVINTYVREGDTFESIRSLIDQNIKALSSATVTWKVAKSGKTYTVDTDLELDQYAQASPESGLSAVAL